MIRQSIQVKQAKKTIANIQRRKKLNIVRQGDSELLIVMPQILKINGIQSKVI